MVSGLIPLFHFILTTIPKRGLVIPILQMRTLRLGKVMYLTPGHIVSKQQICFIPKPTLSTTILSAALTNHPSHTPISPILGCYLLSRSRISPILLGYCTHYGFSMEFWNRLQQRSHLQCHCSRCCECPTQFPCTVLLPLSVSSCRYWLLMRTTLSCFFL